MLQVGAMQEAVTVVPPAFLLLTAPAVLTVATSGFVELQVRGALMRFPEISATVAVIEAELPLAPLMANPAGTARKIDCTGQVLKVIGTLFVFAMEANS